MTGWDLLSRGSTRSLTFSSLVLKGQIGYRCSEGPAKHCGWKHCPSSVRDVHILMWHCAANGDILCCSSETPIFIFLYSLSTTLKCFLLSLTGGWSLEAAFLCNTQDFSSHLSYLSAFMTWHCEGQGIFLPECFLNIFDRENLREVI